MADNNNNNAQPAQGNIEQQIKGLDISEEAQKNAEQEDTEEVPQTTTFEIPHERIKELFAKPELTAEEKFELVRSIGEECIQDSELRNLLAKKPNPICYDGFEPSGRMHIAQGVLKSINVNKCTKSGCTFIFWVADWFALLNNKMGGDLKKIRTVGEYMIEVWRACGMDMTNVKFVWTSDEINSHANEYWLRVMDIARRFKLSRVKRCSTIMGRKESDDLHASQILYPCMQCADIFHLKADICQLGMDQRKVNMLAREYCDEVGIKFKPIILSHHMLMGLKKGQAKMSKSDPESAIFMEDTEADVNVKIKKAWCPEGDLTENPCFDYLKHIVFQKLDSFTILRKEQNGGDKTYTKYEDVVQDFLDKKLHPDDLKPALAKAINEIIRPVREHFATDPNAKKLLQQVKSYKVTK
jgi:tyrosyl-tRNA synthetase